MGYLQNMYSNIFKLRHAMDEEEERLPVMIPRRIPDGPTHPLGMPFRLWCLMALLGQVLELGVKNISMVLISKMVPFEYD